MKKTVVLLALFLVVACFSVAIAAEKPASPPQKSTELRIAELEASNAQLQLDNKIAVYNGAGCGRAANEINSLKKKAEDSKANLEKAVKAENEKNKAKK